MGGGSAVEDVQGAAIEGGGFGCDIGARGVGGGGEEGGQVVEGEAEVGVVWTQDELLDRDGAAVEAFGLGGLAPGLADGGQVVQVDRDLVVRRTVDALEDSERLRIEV